MSDCRTSSRKQNRTEQHPARRPCRRGRPSTRPGPLDDLSTRRPSPATRACANKTNQYGRMRGLLRRGEVGAQLHMQLAQYEPRGPHHWACVTIEHARGPSLTGRRLQFTWGSGRHRLGLAEESETQPIFYVDFFIVPPYFLRDQHTCDEAHVKYTAALKGSFVHQSETSELKQAHQLKRHLRSTVAPLLCVPVALDCCLRVSLRFVLSGLFCLISLLSHPVVTVI